MVALMKVGAPIRLAIAVSILAGAPAAAKPTRGYGDLIDQYCISRGRLRVAAHQSHCAMCHQPGTFDDLPANRIEPNWTEFEQGRATGDFSFFCPGAANIAPSTPASPSVSQSQPPAPQGGAVPTDSPAAQPPSSSSTAMSPGPQMGMDMRMGGMHGGMRERAEMGGMGGMSNMGQAPSPAAPAPSNSVPSAPPGGTGNTGTATSVSPSAAPSGLAPAQAAAAAMLDRPPPVPAELEQRLSRLRDHLGIRDPQRSSWDAFAEAVRSAAMRHREMAQAVQPAAAPAGDALALMQVQERHLSARIAALRYVSTAFTRLLAVLDENQRKRANERFSTLLDAF